MYDSDSRCFEFYLVIFFVCVVDIDNRDHQCPLSFSSFFSRRGIHFAPSYQKLLLALFLSVCSFLAHIYPSC